MSLQEIVEIEGYIQTTYLAVYPEKLLLLDSGCLSDVDSILDYITNTLKRPLSQLKTIVVTHMHPDHAGGAQHIKELTGCDIVTGTSYKPWYSGLKGRISHINDIALTYFVASRQGKIITKIWYDPILKADYELSDGETVPGFEDWKVISTPGHTNHDLSLWHESSNQIYVSDLILKIKSKLVSPYLITLPYVYAASINKVKALQPETVLLAHGGKITIEPEEYDEVIAKIPPEPRKLTLLEGLNFSKQQFKFAKRRAESTN